MSKKAKINIIGNIFGTGGYANHTRSLANALNELVPVKLGCQLPRGWEQSVNDKELEMIKREEGEINLIIAMPHQWKLYTTAKVNIGFLVWEGDKIPKSWIEECINPDIKYIFVPSQHTKDAIEKTLVEGWTDYLTDEHNDKYLLDKIHVMPHGVSDIFSPQTKQTVQIGSGDELSGNPNESDGSTKVKTEDFKFFANKGFKNLEDRGGIQYLLKAYNEEFTKEDNVELLVKINPAYGIPDMDQLLKEIGYKEDSPTLKIMVREVPLEELPKLYNNCDIFVSPTRAEAFNLPCIEAMACGKPVITTNFGGQTDFCNNENGWIIGGELKEVEHDIIYEGIRWLTPDIKELRKVMRFCYDNPNKLKDKSVAALKTAKKYTWAKTAKKIAELIK